MGTCLAHVVRDIPDCRGGGGVCEWNARKGWQKGGLTEHNFAHALSFFFDDGVFQRKRVDQCDRDTYVVTQPFYPGCPFLFRS